MFYKRDKSKDTLKKTHETLVDSDWDSLLPKQDKAADSNLFALSAKKRLYRLHQLYKQLLYSDSSLSVKRHRQFFSKTSVPETFTGSCLLDWFGPFENDIDRQDALTLCQLLLRLGFIISIDTQSNSRSDFQSTSCFIFQHPKLLPSHEWIPDELEYLKFLMRKSKKLSLKDVLTPSQEEWMAQYKDRVGSDEWEDVQILIEKQCEFLKTVSKQDFKVFRLQEHAFWNVMDSLYINSNSDSLFVNSETDLTRKHTLSPIRTNHTQVHSSIETLGDISELMTLNLEAWIDLSAYVQETSIIDPFLTRPIPSNPWISNDTSIWNVDRSPNPNEIEYWCTSLQCLLKDPIGVQFFYKFLQSEFSQENLDFLFAVDKLNQSSNHSDYITTAKQIYAEFIATGAPSEINIVSTIKKNIANELSLGADDSSFQEARIHIYRLLETDPYKRFCKSITQHVSRN